MVEAKEFVGRKTEGLCEVRKPEKDALTLEQMDPRLESDKLKREFGASGLDLRAPKRGLRVPNLESEVPMRISLGQKRESDAQKRESEVPMRESVAPIRELEKGRRCRERQGCEQDEYGWFHICSQGLEGVDLFPDERAFIMGINKFAAAFKLFGEDLEVVILVLVSNHFHSLVWGRRSDVIRCVERFKRTVSMGYSRRFGTSKVMCRVRVKVEKVDSEEYLKNVIGYVLNNPRKHRETNNPFAYPWSSILEYFSSEDYSAVVRPRIVDAPAWRMQKIIGTNRPVPPSWRLYANGMLTFRSFISPARLESVVRTIGSLSYLVNKADLNANQGEAVHYSVNDKAVREAVARLCPKMFPEMAGCSTGLECVPVRNTPCCLNEMRKSACTVAEEMLARLDQNQVERLRGVLSTRLGFPSRIIDRVLPAGFSQG